MAKIGIVSLGCPKALVDSEQIITGLQQSGYEIVNDYHDADLVVVNTCGFIESAIEESLDSIGEALQENGRVIITGCLGVREDFIREHYPQVLEITGPHSREAVISAVQNHLPVVPQQYQHWLPAHGVKLTPSHYAYLKISEGCNHRCSFCIIPSMRGDLVSRPVDEVLIEAEQLVASGVRELLVISQDTSAYGVDMGYQDRSWRGRDWRTHMTDLAAALGELGVWVRLHYVYPYPHVDEVIPLMAEGRLLPYLDIPFQHASPTVLKAMRRPAHAEKTLHRIESWRQMCPELAIRSTFIVGFPGETDEDFDSLLEFIRLARLDRVGCFTYSPVDGATANHLPNPVPEEVARERQQQFMACQAAVSQEKLQNRVGQTLEILIDEVNEDGGVGRSSFDAPEIDGQVIVTGDAQLNVGDFVDVKIVRADVHDLYGEVI